MWITKKWKNLYNVFLCCICTIKSIQLYNKLPHVCTVNTYGGYTFILYVCFNFIRIKRNSHQIVEISIQRLVRNQKNIDIIISLDILFIDDFVEISYQYILLLYMILSRISNMNIYLVVYL